MIKAHVGYLKKIARERGRWGYTLGPTKDVVSANDRSAEGSLEKFRGTDTHEHDLEKNVDVDLGFGSL